MSDNDSVDALLRILDSTKSNKPWFDQRGFIAGYQSIAVQGREFRGQRNTSARLAKVPYDFDGKSVLDVGCSNGALLHNLAPTIRFGVGPLTVVLHPGDTLFIPIGWWQCVKGLDVSISVSFTSLLAPNSFHAEFSRRR